MAAQRNPTYRTVFLRAIAQHHFDEISTVHITKTGTFKNQNFMTPCQHETSFGRRAQNSVD